LDQALKWADAAISLPFVGRRNFTTLSTKALVLAKMGRDADAKTVMETALHDPTATPVDIHQYARQLLAAKKTAEAMEVFQYNAKRNGDAWPVHVGLARGYSATGDLQKALEHAKLALPQAPDPQNRQGLEGMIATLSQGKPLDQ
jgi:Tfp pilus assembly protein PilF